MHKWINFILFNFPNTKQYKISFIIEDRLVWKSNHVILSFVPFKRIIILFFFSLTDNSAMTCDDSKEIINCHTKKSNYLNVRICQIIFENSWQNNGELFIKIQKISASRRRICSNASVPKLAGTAEKFKSKFKLRRAS